MTYFDDQATILFKVKQIIVYYQSIVLLWPLQGHVLFSFVSLVININTKNY